jgi:hypothetical protein
MTILGKGGGPKKSTPPENKCFLIGHKLKIGPIDFTLEPVRREGPKKSTQPEHKCFLIGRKLKIGPIDFTLETIRQGGGPKNQPNRNTSAFLLVVCSKLAPLNSH